MTPPWSLYFSDGSGNGYTFSQDEKLSSVEFRYTPVQPMFSSSGFYSGGDRQASALSADKALLLQELFNGLAQRSELHRSNPRPIGTGYFKLTQFTSNLEFVICHSPELKTFDIFAQKCNEG